MSSFCGVLLVQWHQSIKQKDPINDSSPQDFKHQYFLLLAATFLSVLTLCQLKICIRITAAPHYHTLHNADHVCTILKRCNLFISFILFVLNWLYYIQIDFLYSKPWFFFSLLFSRVGNASLFHLSSRYSTPISTICIHLWLDMFFDSCTNTSFLWDQ